MLTDEDIEILLAKIEPECERIPTYSSFHMKPVEGIKSTYFYGLRDRLRAMLRKP